MMHLTTLHVQQMLSSFTNILWPEVIAAYGKFTKMSTDFPIVREALEKEENLYPTNKPVLAKIMTKCHKVISVHNVLLGTGTPGKTTTATHICDVPGPDRAEIGQRLLYVHLGLLAYFAFTPKAKGIGYTKGSHKLIEDMLEGYLTPQLNGLIRCTRADMVSVQFKTDLAILGLMYMEFKCMQTPANMPTWADLQTVFNNHNLIVSTPPTASDVLGRSFLLNPFFRTIAPNAVPGSLDSAAWSALSQNSRVVILMLMVRTFS
jgi:hypothetical protein